MTTLETLVISSPQDTHCVIWLHGLGASKHDFESVSKIIKQQLPYLGFVLPQAPSIKVSLNADYIMPAWYDIKSLTDASLTNPKELNKATLYIKDIIKSIEHKFTADKIFLAGFSQGGAVALHTAFIESDVSFAGIIALSTYSPSFTHNLPINHNTHNTKVLCCHGTRDEVLDFSMGVAVVKYLQNNKIKVEFKQYDMAHEVIMEEIECIISWLKQHTQ